MSYTVTVLFSPDKEYEFMLHDGDVEGMDREQARAWLFEEFQELECVPSSPSGKVLLVDMILSVARYAEEARFQENDEWAKNYARAVAAALRRSVIKVDVWDSVVG